MPKVTEEYRAARRQEIAHAALRCFVRKGFQGTSMADIIAESGLSAGAIYGHYKSKDELVQLAASEVLETRFGEIDEAQAQSPMPAPGEVLGAFVRGIERTVGDFGLLVQIWAQGVVDPQIRIMAAQVVERISERYREYLKAWLLGERGLPPVEAQRRAELYAPLFLGICQGYIVQSALLPGFDAETYLAASTAINPAAPLEH